MDEKKEKMDGKLCECLLAKAERVFWMKIWNPKTYKYGLDSFDKSSFFKIKLMVENSEKEKIRKWEELGYDVNDFEFYFFSHYKVRHVSDEITIKNKLTNEKVSVKVQNNVDDYIRNLRKSEVIRYQKRIKKLINKIKRLTKQAKEKN